MPFDIVAYSYAATVAAGGILGYVKSHSIPSLGAGLLFGTILGYGAYQTSADPTNVGVLLGASSTLGGIMGYRFYNTGKIMPAGVITLISAAMIVRTIFKYFTAVPPMKAQ
ncbi:transmembrane protein 14C [Hylaeus anthracinus]|uniref:transmembrane protein 14C n=1 Tax=Hylaeus volcanicus TaxID=313075 RepID=UPI0023B78C51|nr:transmembrane protein 14C [Hylaeus volcanicus]XP_054004110.1 transmembrane protein 14C [Hylaeus anthracinus]